MLCIFSALLSRLNGGGSELGDVLGHLEGVEKADFDGDTHGGLVETSQLLALHPDWVDPRFKELPRRNVELWLEERGEARPKAQRGKLAALGEMLAAVPGRDPLLLGRDLQRLRRRRRRRSSASASSTRWRVTRAELVTQLLDGELPEAEWHSPLWKLRHVFVNPLAVRLADAWLRVPRTVS